MFYDKKYGFAVKGSAPNSPTLTVDGALTVGGRTTSAGFTSSIDGSVGTPAINRSDDLDTGIYWDVDGYIRFATNGAFTFGLTGGTVQSIGAHTMNAALTANSSASFNGLVTYSDRFARTPRLVDIDNAADTVAVAGATGPVVRITLSLGAIVSTAAPFMADGVDGQEIELIRSTDAGTLTINDETTVAGSNLRLSSATFVMGPRDSILLRFVSAIGDWVEVSRVNAL